MLNHKAIEIGTNKLVGTSIVNLILDFAKLNQFGLLQKGIPELWDGKASGRIIDVLLSIDFLN